VRAVCPALCVAACKANAACRAPARTCVYNPLGTACERGTAPRSDHLFELNFAITLYNNDEIDMAREHFNRFEALYQKLDDETKNSDPDIAEQRQALSSLLS